MLERICSANGLTQKDMAGLIGVAPETVTRWKSEFSPPTEDLFRALAALRQFEPGLTADELVGHVPLEG